MGRKKKDGDAAGASAGSKSRLVPSIIVAAGLVGGGYFMGGHKSPPAAVGAAARSPATTTSAAPGPVVMLGSITLNLTDTHYLKVGVALQLAGTDKPKTTAKTAAADASSGATGEWARALDATITELGSRDSRELSTADGRQRAKDALGARIVALYPDQVMTIYFTEFVMQ